MKSEALEKSTRSENILSQWIHGLYACGTALNVEPKNDLQINLAASEKWLYEHRFTLIFSSGGQDFGGNYACVRAENVGEICARFSLMLKETQNYSKKRLQKNEAFALQRWPMLAYSPRPPVPSLPQVFHQRLTDPRVQLCSPGIHMLLCWALVPQGPERVSEDLMKLKWGHQDGILSSMIPVCVRNKI